MKKQKKSKGTKETTKKPEVKLTKFCKQELINKYNELMTINFKDKDILPEVGDDIDLARMTLDKEILHELTDTQRNLLDLINLAIEKIDKNEFGVCETCKKLIPIKRIKAIPWARHCIECQTNLEKK